jgi:hypothetical protein
MSFQQITTLEQIFPYLRPRTLIVLDLDNTLIESTTTYGSFQWAVFLRKQKMSQGFSFEDALDFSVNSWELAQFKVQMRCLEQCSPSWLDALREKGVPILGLTGRTQGLTKITMQVLSELKLNFSSLDLNFENHLSIDYQDGVIFVGHRQDKGKVLFQALEQLPLSFDRILFVDDQKKYLEQVQNVASLSSLEVFGFHFVKCSSRFEEFDPVLAEKEALLLNA